MNMGLLLLGAFLVGCARLPVDPADTIPDADLLSGVALVGRPVEPSEEDPRSILAVDEAMDAFVTQHVGTPTADGTKLRRLIAGMKRSGLLNLAYDSDATQTAAEVFHSRRGNCLSSTNLFVALARRAGLDVAFQRVEIPPVWLAESGFVILDEHVNAVVFDGSVRGSARRDYVVDFNDTQARSQFEQVRVADSYAFALFFNNLAVEKMMAGDSASAIAHLSRAIELAPSIPGPWVNLGALYSKNERYEHAIGAYRAALRVDASSKPALSNLANLHEFLGHTALAQEYRRQVVYYQNRNPYYHFAMARNALHRGDYAESLAAIERAIRLREKDHQFHFLRGVVEMNLGDLAAARDSLEKARRYAEVDDVRRRYEAKLDALARL